MAAGGDVTVERFSVGDAAPVATGPREDMVVGGFLDFVSGAVLSGGNMRFGSASAATLADPTSVTAPGQKLQGQVIDFQPRFEQLRRTSMLLAQQPTTGSVTDEGGVAVLDAGTALAATHVFQLGTTLLDSAHTLDVRSLFVSLCPSPVARLPPFTPLACVFVCACLSCGCLPPTCPRSSSSTSWRTTCRPLATTSLRTLGLWVSWAPLLKPSNASCGIFRAFRRLTCKEC